MQKTWTDLLAKKKFLTDSGFSDIAQCPISIRPPNRSDSCSVRHLGAVSKDARVPQRPIDVSSDCFGVHVPLAGSALSFFVVPFHFPKRYVLPVTLADSRSTSKGVKRLALKSRQN